MRVRARVRLRLRLRGGVRVRVRVTLLARLVSLLLLVVGLERRHELLEGSLVGVRG